MKLELKHIAPYLPYGLKILNLSMHENGFKTEHSVKNLVATPSNLEIGLKDVDGIKEKPILRPISDLTKEIEVNGEKFVPMECLCSVEISEEEDFKLYGKIPEYWKDFIKTKIEYWDFWQVEMVLKWHFDIHNLIENNLAIDINTL